MRRDNISESQGSSTRLVALLTYVLDGVVYVADVNWLYEHTSFLHEETVAYVMPSERAVDIDNEINTKIDESVIDVGDRFSSCVDQ